MIKSRSKLAAIWIFVLVAVALSGGNATAGDKVWHCTEEFNSGQLFKDGRWKETNFKLHRYTVKLVGSDHKQIVVGGLIGRRNTHMACSKSWNFITSGIVFCRVEASSFSYNVTTKRFAMTKVFGAMDWKPGMKDPDSVHVSQGTCVEF